MFNHSNVTFDTIAEKGMNLIQYSCQTSYHEGKHERLI